MSRDDLLRLVERELNEKGVVSIPQDASQQDINDILDAGMEVVRRQERSEG